MNARRDKILKLRKAGLGYAEIGRRLGISRQWVERVIKGKLEKPKPDLYSKRTLRIGEAAELLGLHPNTVRRFAEQGILKCHRINPRGDRRFRREEIEAFLERGKTGKLP